MALKLLAPLALFLGMFGGASGAKMSCCAPSADCCNPPQECCGLVNTKMKAGDCCNGGDCCNPPQECCGFAAVRDNHDRK